MNLHLEKETEDKGWREARMVNLTLDIYTQNSTLFIMVHGGYRLPLDKSEASLISKFLQTWVEQP